MSVHCVGEKGKWEKPKIQLEITLHETHLMPVMKTIKEISNFCFANELIYTVHFYNSSYCPQLMGIVVTFPA